MSSRLAYLLLDTNVLLLWLVAQVDLRLLKSFKRLSGFEVGDHELLASAVAGYRYLITTPHILAEVSNFLDQSPLWRRNDLMTVLARFAKEQREHYDRAATLVERREFLALGIADTGLLSLSFEAMVLTTDVRLYARILGAGGYAMNFNHLRDRIVR